MSWQQCTINDVCLLITDGTHYTPPDVGEGVPFLTVKDFSHDGKADMFGCSHITESDFEKADSGNCAPKHGDVLFSKDGTVGKVYEVGSEERFAVLSSVAILRPDSSKLDTGYFGCVLKSDICLDQASQSKTGSAIRRIILKDLKRVKFPLPPLAEQKRIAAILDAANALRNQRREALAQFDTLLQSTFLDMFGDPVTNPKGWEVKSFGELVANEDGLRIPVKKSDRAQMAGEFPYYGASGVIDRVDDYLFEGDRLLIGEDGANLVARATPIAFIASGKYWVNNHAHVLAYNGEAELLFLATMINSIDIQKYVSGSAQPKLNQKNLNRILIPTPPLDLQHRFAGIVESVEQQKARMRTHLDELDTLFASLQSRAFKGEL